ncbi:unnamed protein product [Urochloa humidicola]
MATGDDGQHQGGRYKRCRAAGDSINDDENNVPDKRRQLSAAGADGGEADAGHGTGDYYYIISSDDEMDGGDEGEGLIYYFTDDDEGETEVGESSAIQSTTEKSYVILSEDDIRHRQSRDTAEVAEVLSIPAGFAAVLLRHYKWDPTNLQAHRPVSCSMVRAWLAKNKSDSETANWVLVNTKLCPNCHKAIEKNQGCNHMRCVCGHHFCWLCLKPAGGQHYACDVYDPAAAPGRRKARKNKEDARARRARMSLDRYLFHYERWVGNMRSLQKAKQDMEEMERSELEGMAAMVGRPVTELAFMKEAYEQVIYGRRVLRWAHAYGAGLT